MTVCVNNKNTFILKGTKPEKMFAFWMNHVQTDLPFLVVLSRYIHHKHNELYFDYITHNGREINCPLFENVFLRIFVC